MNRSNTIIDSRNTHNTLFDEQLMDVFHRERSQFSESQIIRLVVNRIKDIRQSTRIP